MSFPALTATEQAALVERIAGGDRAAEGRVAELFAPAVQAMARARARGAVDAQDVCQDVLLAVITALRQGRLRDSERLGPFVAGVARNVINSYLRQRQSRSTEPLSEAASPVADLRDEMARRERDQTLRTALSEVSASDRQILLLTLVEGLKPGEVATKLSLDAQVVRARKSRALRRVIDRLRGS